MIDDKGNEVVFQTESGDKIATLDRESDPIEGLCMQFGYAWNGEKRETEFACEKGYDLEIAIAIMCNSLRGDSVADQQMRDFIQYQFS